MEPEASSSASASPSTPRIEKDVSSSPPAPPAASSSKPTPSAPARGGRRSLDSSTGAGRRMFGLLNQTLSKANAENARGIQAANRRAEIEARQKKTLEKRMESLESSERLRAELEGAKREVVDMACDIAQQDALVRVRKAQKRRMASFLVAVPDEARGLLKVRGDQQRERSKEIDRVIAPGVPLVLGPARTAAPVYYLPKKMLGAQDDTMDAQEDQVDEKLEKADKEWAARRSGMVDELRRLKTRVRSLTKEVEELKQDQGEHDDGDARMQDSNGAGTDKASKPDDGHLEAGGDDDAMAED